MIIQIFNLMRFFALNTYDVELQKQSCRWIGYSALVLFYLLIQFAINLSAMMFEILGSKINVVRAFAAFFLFFSEMFCAVISVLISLLQYDKKVEVFHKLLELNDTWPKVRMCETMSKFIWLKKFLPFFSFFISSFLIDVVGVGIYGPKEGPKIIMLHYSARLIIWTDMYHFFFILKIVRLHFISINNELTVVSKSLAKFNLYYSIGLISQVHEHLRSICKKQNFLYRIQFCLFYFYIISVITTYAFLIVSENALILSISSFYVNDAWIVFNGYMTSWILSYIYISFIVINEMVNVAEQVRTKEYFKEYL